MAEMTVRIEGSTTTSTGAQTVTTGSTSSTASLSAASATGAGTTVDFGSAKANVTLVCVASAGVTAGAVSLEVSQDGTNWFRVTPAITLTAPGVQEVTKAASAYRYARANVTTAITGGTVTCTIMAS